MDDRERREINSTAMGFEEVSKRHLPSILCGDLGNVAICGDGDDVKSVMLTVLFNATRAPSLSKLAPPEENLLLMTYHPGGRCCAHDHHKSSPIFTFTIFSPSQIQTLVHNNFKDNC